MSEESNTSGFGLPSIVFIVFLILKLAKIGDVAEWDWWWILSPLLIKAGFIIISVAITAFDKVWNQDND